MEQICLPDCFAVTAIMSQVGDDFHKLYRCYSAVAEPFYPVNYPSPAHTAVGCGPFLIHDGSIELFC